MNQSSARGGSDNGLRRRMTTRPVLLAWAVVVIFAGLVLWLGTPNFSSSRSFIWLANFLRFFDPDIDHHGVLLVHKILRKGMHLVVYGALALLAFRASFLSFGNVLLRVAATAVMIAVGVAMVDEGRQATYSERTGSPVDVLIDGTGAAIAVGLAALALRRGWLRGLGAHKPNASATDGEAT